MQRLWKGLATVTVLVLLYLRGSPVSEYSLPRVPWTILFIATLTYGISLVFSLDVTPSRRLAIAYMILGGFVYFLAGIAGLLPHWGLIEASVWRSVISPYLLISFLDFPYGAPYEVAPQSEHHMYSALVIVVSLAAILASLGMAANKKVADRVCLALLGLVSLAFLGHVIVGYVSWGMNSVIVPFCWEASYVAAYLLARRGAHFQ